MNFQVVTMGANTQFGQLYSYNLVQI